MYNIIPNIITLKGTYIMKARKIIIPVCIVAGLAAAGFGVYSVAKSAAVPAYAEASLVEKKDSLSEYVTVTGTVKSASAKNVFAKLSYPIEGVYASVGDVVHKGDKLCVLDSSSLQSEILSQQTSIDNNNVTTQYQLTQAEKDYQSSLDEYNNGTSSAIMSCKQTLEMAKTAVEKAQENYDNAVAMSSRDKSSQLKSAELSLQNAKDAYNDAVKALEDARKETEEEDYYSIDSLKKAYEDAQDTFKKASPTNNEIRAAQQEYEVAYSSYCRVMAGGGSAYESAAEYASAVSAAEQKLAALSEKYDVVKSKERYQEALKAYEKAKADIDEAHSAAEKNAEKAVENAKKSVESAEIALQAVKDETGNGIKAYKTQLADAQLQYENAKDNLAAAETAAEKTLATLKENAERERTLSGLNNVQLIALKNLEEQLEETEIYAPCNGTVTMVNAVEGTVPAGTLFTIEDTSDLIVTANLREYDVSNVKVGMPVKIKSDALGEEYEGIVTKIAPTAAKLADGSDAGTALFETEIAVTSKDTALKIGMTARLSIIVEEVTDVFAITYDSISADENGSDIIYVAEKTDLGYTVKKVPVTVGLETDYLAEISGEGISEDTIVLSDTDLLIEGQTVLINEAELGIAPAEDTAETAESEGKSE